MPNESIVGSVDTDTGREKQVFSVSGHFQSVVQITGFELGIFATPAGSGILISPRHVLTAAHVLGSGLIKSTI